MEPPRLGGPTEERVLLRNAARHGWGWGERHRGKEGSAKRPPFLSVQLMSDCWMQTGATSVYLHAQGDIYLVIEMSSPAARSCSMHDDKWKRASSRPTNSQLLPTT